MHAIIAQRPCIQGIPVVPDCLLQQSLARKSMTRRTQHPCERRDVLLVMTKGYLPLRMRRTALLSAVHDRCNFDKGMQGDASLPQWHSISQTSALHPAQVGMTVFLVSASDVQTYFFRSTLSVESWAFQVAMM